MIGGTIALTMMTGDYINILDKTIYPLKYSHKIDKDSYQRPFKLRKRYVINENNNLEVHIGNNEKWAKVRKSLTTSDKNLDEVLSEKGQKLKEDFLKWYRKNF